MRRWPCRCPDTSGDAAGGDVHVLQQVERDEAVVARRLQFIDDLAELAQVRRAQIVADVVDRLGSETSRILPGSTLRKVRPSTSKVETPRW